MDRSLMTFLNQLISYYSKTRTLHTLILHLLSALTSSFPFLHSSDPQVTYAMCTRSPLLSLPFIDGLTNALQIFITPGQADEVVRSVKETLESFLRLRETSQLPERKRRKVSSEVKRIPPVARNRDNGPDIIKFALVARLGTTALRTVLHRTADKDALEMERRCLSGLDGPITDALHAAFHATFCLEEAAGNTSTKILGKRPRSDRVDEPQWRHQLLSSAILRLWYELFAERGMVWMNMETDENWVATETLDHLSKAFGNYLGQDIYPELQLEIVSPTEISIERGE